MGQRPFLFCLVPSDRTDTLLEALREHFAGDPQVVVLVERRTPVGDRPPAYPAGRRDSRAQVAKRDLLLALPPELRGDARYVRLVQRLETLGRTHERATTAELLQEIRAKNAEAVSELWWRFSERVRLRLRLRLGEVAAETAAHDVLGRILDELDGYDEEQPLLVWLYEVVDRYADQRAP
jgi:hypothetical protein